MRSGLAMGASLSSSAVVPVRDSHTHAMRTGPGIRCGSRASWECRPPTAERQHADSDQAKSLRRERTDRRAKGRSDEYGAPVDQFPRVGIDPPANLIR
jgi:hypothetical protein